MAGIKRLSFVPSIKKELYQEASTVVSVNYNAAYMYLPMVCLFSECISW